MPNCFSKNFVNNFFIILLSVYFRHSIMSSLPKMHLSRKNSIILMCPHLLDLINILNEDNYLTATCNGFSFIL